MRFIRNIVLSLIVSLSVSLAGMPAYACHEVHNGTSHADSSEATKAKVTTAAYQSHENEDNHLAQLSKSCLCCGISSAALPDSQFSLPEFSEKAIQTYAEEQALFSRTPQTQDRPPKFLS